MEQAPEEGELFWGLGCHQELVAERRVVLR